MSVYTTREAAELVGLSMSRIRAYARAGLVAVRAERAPGSRHRFAFQDIVLLRMAKRLHEARVPPRTIRRTMSQMRRHLPQGKPLSALRVVVEGGQVLIRDQRTLWHPESGQLSLDLSLNDLGGAIAPLVRAAQRQAEQDTDLDSDDWYNLGVDLEMVEEPAKARAAYEKSLALNRRNDAALVNLGRLFHALRQWADAERCYRQSLEINPQQGTAWFNLGVLFEDRGDPTQALDAYGQALHCDNRMADAHYNLARLHEQFGNTRLALRNFRAYKNLMS